MNHGSTINFFLKIVYLLLSKLGELELTAYVVRSHGSYSCANTFGFLISKADKFPKIYFLKSFSFFELVFSRRLSVVNVIGFGASGMLTVEHSLTSITGDICLSCISVLESPHTQSLEISSNIVKIRIANW